MMDLIFEVDYESGPWAVVDWIAGGNFDGYVSKSVLRFYKKGSLVKIMTQILDQSRYDGFVEKSEITGIFKETDHKTITLYFENFQMRGKTLGHNKEFIAFSTQSPHNHFHTSCYQLKPD